MDPSTTPMSKAANFVDYIARVNGIDLHYQVGGAGSPVVLLHGFAETGHMWEPVMAGLAKTHRVVVPDLRGAGASGKPADGYDKLTMAQDIHALAASLGERRITIVGHDIGLMVAYAYAAQYPDEAERVVLMDAFLPGIGDWKAMWLMRDLWHFHFYGPVPEALVAGRERTYLEHFWNDFAADPAHSVPEAERQLYAAAFAQPGAVHAGFEYFHNFERDAADFQRLAARKLPMPVRVIAGERSGGTFLIDQVKLVADDVEGTVIPGAGHWLLEEAPDRVIPVLTGYVH